MRAAARLFFVEALRALARNRLRTTLAAIAVMIGIGAVVCVVAIGRDGSRRAEEQLQNLGDNFVQIEAGSRAPNGVRTGSHGTTSLTLGDAEAIERERAIPAPETRAPTGESTGEHSHLVAEREVLQRELTLRSKR